MEEAEKEEGESHTQNRIFRGLSAGAGAAPAHTRDNTFDATSLGRRRRRTAPPSALASA